ncbi:hypothetical protein [Caldicellulosiruptor sp. F32]|uniref:hypothetical protein n=1 Tax=Caldicellulosiruptor sp. F32 TaxID=1214564 RepID=UPI0003A68128|nr:hypothetical protein [Caldicellulosiruptor sp. F32]
MNDEKLDNLFEEAFKVEYRKEFKEELKSMLLKEYDKRKKSRFYLKVSTAVAACLVLSIILFLSFKLNMGNFRVPNSSFMRNEIEQALNLDLNEESKIQEQYSVSVKQKEGTKSEAVLQEDKTSNQNQEEKNLSVSSQEGSKKIVEKKASTQKQLSQKQEEKRSATDKINAKSKLNMKTKQVSKSKSLENQSTRVKANSQANSKMAENYSNRNDNKTSKSSTATIPTLPSNGGTSNKKTEQKVVINKKNGNINSVKSVFTSVYVLKEENMNLKEDDIIIAVSDIIGGEVYKSFFAENVPNSVYVSVYQDYCYFEVLAKEDFKLMADVQESVEEKVYKEAKSILDKLGLEDYKIFVTSQNDVYRANIIFYIQGYELYDSQGYIEFDRFGKVKKGKIYLKKFSPLQKVEIYDIQTAVVEYKKRYNIEDIDISRIKVVYKKQGNVYVPVYMYIDKNKIYWLEK